ncbi:MAG: hypothetical protein ACKO3P_01530, partial [Planctomycetaceae bacterium]
MLGCVLLFAASFPSGSPTSGLLTSGPWTSGVVARAGERVGERPTVAAAPAVVARAAPRPADESKGAAGGGNFDREMAPLL